tara:strand:+ start:97 stop:483 length:387 start_codon:yes stop_codon:yes gene_type:complete
MNFDHPLFSGTEDELWTSIDAIEDLGDSELSDIIENETSHIISKASDTFRSFIKDDIVGIGDLELEDFLVRPMKNQRKGFLAYLHFSFPAKEPHDSDSWWIILGCSDSTIEASSKPKYYPWSFGWFCQ